MQQGRKREDGMRAFEDAKVQLWKQATITCEPQPAKYYMHWLPQTDNHLKKVWAHGVKQSMADARSQAREAVHQGKYFIPPSPPGPGPSLRTASRGGRKQPQG